MRDFMADKLCINLKIYGLFVAAKVDHTLDLKDEEHEDEDKKLDINGDEKDQGIADGICWLARCTTTQYHIINAAYKLHRDK